MPVSGRPANSALLKITQGSSGVATKSFQRNARAVGGSATSVFTIRLALARSNNSVTSAATSSTDSVMTLVNHAYWRGVRDCAVGDAVVRGGAGGGSSGVGTKA